MPRFQKGQGGRPKGAKNRVSGAAKEIIAQAANELGGAERLVAWVKEAPENERYFWSSIYPRLLPHEVTGADGDPLVVEIVRFGVERNDR